MGQDKDSSRIESMSAVDAAWFQMDAPGNAADISILLLLDDAPNLERLEETIRARLLSRYRRFRQRVIHRGGRPAWTDDKAFDLAHHVRRTTLPRPGDRRTLETFIGEVSSQPIDATRPLWNLTLIDGTESGCALLVRVHHCIGDGFGLAAAFLRLADRVPVATDDRRIVFDAKVETTSEHRTLSDALLREVESIRRYPAQVAELAQQTTAAVSSLAHLALLPFDPATRLKSFLSGVRRVAWTNPVPLSRIKAIGRGLGATVNDTLLTAMTGAMRQLLADWGDAVDDHQIRAVVPINLRPARSIEDMSTDLGNRFGLVFLDLPVHCADPHQRLVRLKASMDTIKGSPEAVVAFGILQALGVTPPVVQNTVSEVFTKKSSLVVTNVPGPRDRLYLAGQRLRDVVFWVPHPVQLGLGMSILSYAGTVRVGIRSDAAVVDDPARLASQFEAELDRLQAAEHG